jgi:hypothetical protein
VQRVRQAAEDKPGSEEDYMMAASLMVAFHAGNVWSEEELATRLLAARHPSFTQVVRWQASRRGGRKAHLCFLKGGIPRCCPLGILADFWSRTLLS